MIPWPCDSAGQNDNKRDGNIEYMDEDCRRTPESCPARSATGGYSFFEKSPPANSLHECFSIQSMQSSRSGYTGGDGSFKSQRSALNSSSDLSRVTLRSPAFSGHDGDDGVDEFDVDTCDDSLSLLINSPYGMAGSMRGTEKVTLPGIIDAGDEDIPSYTMTSFRKSFS